MHSISEIIKEDMALLNPLFIVFSIILSLPFLIYLYSKRRAFITHFKTILTYTKENRQKDKILSNLRTKEETIQYYRHVSMTIICPILYVLLIIGMIHLITLNILSLLEALLLTIPLFANVSILVIKSALFEQSLYQTLTNRLNQTKS